MSYDLMVFDAAEAPKERSAFLEWYDDLTEWAEPHTYFDPVVTTPPLRAWFMEMIQAWPAMNGPFQVAFEQSDTPMVTGYSIGYHAIYVDFRWSVARAAYGAVFRCAGQHGVGFFDVSSEKGEVWLPDGRGGLTLAHSG